MTNSMSSNVQSPQQPRTKKRRGFWACCGCLGVSGLIVVLFAATPLLLRALGIFGQSAKQAYSGGRDPYASAQIQDVFQEHQIQGVDVYVMPVRGESYNQVFVYLDASKGYQGLSPAGGTSDEVFDQVLAEVVDRDRNEGLLLERFTLAYYDENGEKALAFTTPMSNVDDYVDGVIGKEEFFGNVYFDVMKTVQHYGLQDALQELQNQQNQQP